MSKKYFEAIGRQRWSIGLGFSNLDMRRMHDAGLPWWAVDAALRGYQAQIPWRKAVEPIKSRMAAESMRT